MILLILSDIMVKIYRRIIQIAPAGFEIDRVVKPAIDEKAEKVYLMVSKNKTERDYAIHKKYFTENQKRVIIPMPRISSSNDICLLVAI